MLRKIIKIDEEKCNGCELCIPGCAEGALQVIDGKVRLISDLFCDGLGACIGHCPEGALTIEEREAEPYDESKVMEYIVSCGANVIKAHLEHLRDHEEFEYLTEALEYLRSNGIDNPLHHIEIKRSETHFSGCPGSKSMSFQNPDIDTEKTGKRQSYLTQWPIQLHLISPFADYYKNSDLLLAADCVGFSYPDFHKDFLKGKSLAVACPKLDTNQEVYLEKLISMITVSNLKSITVLIMQVPCCGGLLYLAQKAIESSCKDVPVKAIVIGIRGEILQEISV